MPHTDDGPPPSPRFRLPPEPQLKDRAISRTCTSPFSKASAFLASMSFSDFVWTCAYGVQPAGSTMCRHRGRQDAARARQSAGCVFICSWFGTCEVKSRRDVVLGAAPQCACYMRRGVVTRIARLVGLTRGMLYSTLLGAQHSTAQRDQSRMRVVVGCKLWICGLSIA